MVMFPNNTSLYAPLTAVWQPCRTCKRLCCHQQIAVSGYAPRQTRHPLLKSIFLAGRWKDIGLTARPRQSARTCLPGLSTPLQAHQQMTTATIEDHRVVDLEVVDAAAELVAAARQRGHAAQRGRVVQRQLVTKVRHRVVVRVHLLRHVPVLPCARTPRDARCQTPLFLASRYQCVAEMPPLSISGNFILQAMQVKAERAGPHRWWSCRAYGPSRCRSGPRPTSAGSGPRRRQRPRLPLHSACCLITTVTPYTRAMGSSLSLVLHATCGAVLPSEHDNIGQMHRWHAPGLVGHLTSSEWAPGGAHVLAAGAVLEALLPLVAPLLAAAALQQPLRPLRSAHEDVLSDPTSWLRYKQ